jgi:hypothetical protein
LGRMPLLHGGTFSRMPFDRSLKRKFEYVLVLDTIGRPSWVSKGAAEICP